MLPLKRGEGGQGVAQLSLPCCLPDMRLADTLVLFYVYLGRDCQKSLRSEHVF